MTRWMVGLALSSLAAGTAAAQPPPQLAGPPPALAGPPAPAGPPSPLVASPPPAGPVLGPQPAPVAEPPAPPPPSAPLATELAQRPTGLSIGIGVGYTFPTSLQTPNITTVRLRLPSGLTFEPELVLAETSTTLQVGSNSQDQLTLGSLVRYPLRARHNVDLEAIGSAAISSHITDPAGANNNRSITSFDLGYGLALAYWLTHHWSISLTATNSLFSIARTRQEAGAGNAMVTRTTTGGLVFDPQVAVMLHLYD